MDIRNDKRVIITGRRICLAAGVLSAICGIYWLVQALFYDQTNLPVLLSCITTALFLTLYARK